MQHLPRALGALTLGATLVLAACGDGGSEKTGAPTSLTRVIDISMTDNAYSATDLAVSPGEEVTFRFRNDGSVEHEAILGTEAQQDDHEMEMNSPTGDDMGDMDMGDMEGMDHSGEELPAVTVAPGESADLTYRFDEGGDLIIGCHIPGHYEAGMRANINVA